MTYVLRVGDTRNHVFLYMSEILDAVQPEAAALNWAILDLGEAFAPDGSDLDVLDLERQVAQLPAGLRMSFAELVQFASGLQQVIDGLFVAASDGARLPSRADPDQIILGQADIGRGGHVRGQECAPPGNRPHATEPNRERVLADTRNYSACPSVRGSAKKCPFAGTSDAGGGTRTPDTRIMIPLL